MRMEKIVFLRGRAQQLHGVDGVTILERYTFRDDISAAKVEVDNESRLYRVPTVQGVEDVDIAFEIRLVDPGISVASDSVATIDDVRTLHEMPVNGSGTGDGQTVVVMDSGIDESHPIFDGMNIEHVDVVGGGTEDEVGHGTACAGQIARLAPDADLISLRIFGDSGRTSMDVILRAYQWLHSNTEKYDIVNMSWGASRKVNQLDRVHSELVKRGVRDVVAAGNTGDTGGSPATAERAFSIGACDEDGKLASFSSYNPNYDNPDVTAIGENNRLAQADGTTMGQDLEGRYVKASGTSFACPEAAGAVAKFFDFTARGGSNPSGRANRAQKEERDVVRKFQKYAQNIPDTPREGDGVLKYESAVAGEPPRPQPETATAHIWSLWTGGQDMVYINEDWFDDGKYRVTKMPNGELRFKKK